MKKIVSMMSVLLLAVPVVAGTVEGRGQEWLDEHKDPPQVNVTGTWQSRDWPTVTLTQATGSREVTGSDKKFEVAGVVSGKNVYLLFSKNGGGVSFCATLTSDADNSLTGMYSYRVTRLKFGHGLCQDKGYRLNMKRASAGPAAK